MKKIDAKKYPVLTSLIKANVSYPRSEIVLLLVGNVEVDAELKAKINDMLIDVKPEKGEDGQEYSASPKIKILDSSAPLSEKDAEEKDREHVMTVMVPLGQEDKFFKEVQKPLKKAGFEVSKLEAFRHPMTVEKPKKK